MRELNARRAAAEAWEKGGRKGPAPEAIQEIRDQVRAMTAEQDQRTR